MMSSVEIAGAAIEAVLDKVAHIKYMEELEGKLRPYVINYTTSQALKCQEDIGI